MESVLFHSVGLSLGLEAAEAGNEVTLLPTLHSSVEIFLCHVFGFHVFLLAGVDNHFSFGSLDILKLG